MGVLDNIVDQHKSSVAIIDGDKRITYLELAKYTSNFSREYLRSNDLVIIECKNELTPLIAYLSALNLKVPCILVPDGTHHKSDLAECFKASVIVRSVDDKWDISRTNFVPSCHEDLAVMLSTSGSTGSSKLVRLSLDNIVQNAKSIAEYLQLSESDQSVTTLPFHYSYGLSVINSHLISGASFVLTDKSVTEASFWDLFSKPECNITNFAGVPYTFDLLDKVGFSEKQLPGLRFITQAGGKLHPDKIKKNYALAKRKNFEFFVMYGQTEATARISFIPPDQLANNEDSIGIAIPRGKLEIIDDSGSQVKGNNIEGELVYSGPNVMMGYAETASDLSKGKEIEILKTGDIAIRKDNGFYSIKGRMKRFIKLFGVRTNLDEVEGRLGEKGLNVSCTGFDELLVIAIEGGDTKKILKEASLILDLPMNAISVIAYKRLPLLPSGKVDYKTIQLDANNVDESKEVNLRKEFCSILRIDSVGDEDTFISLGGDSLTYVGASVTIEKHLGYLPNNWETLSLLQLESQKKSNVKNNMFSKVEVGIFLRFFAIMAVVANHAGLGFGGGAALLMVIAGYNYVRFQWPKLLLGEGFGVVKSLFINILLPYWLILVGYMALKGYVTHPYDLLMISNSIYPKAAGVPFQVWFVQTLIQCIVLFSLPLIFKKVRNWAAENQVFYIGFFAVFLLVLRVLDELFGFGVAYNLQGGQSSWVAWLFGLGAITFALRDQSKVVLSILATIFAFVFYSPDYSRVIFIALGSILLLWLPHIRVPRLSLGLIQAISAASLFIYMLHGRAPVDSVTAQWLIDIIRIGVGILIGFVVYTLYNFGWTVLAKIKQVILKRRD